MHVFKRLLVKVKPYWWRILLAMIAMGVVAAATSSIAFLIKPMVDQIFQSRAQDKLFLVSGLVVLAFLGKAVFYLFQAYQMNFVGQTVVNNLRVELYAHLQTLSLSFFHRNSSGVLISRLTYDVNLIQTSVTEGVTGLIMDFFTAFGLLFVIFYRDWKLALAGVLIIPLAVYPLYKFSRKVRTVYRQAQISMGRLTTILQETFQGTRIVKAFGMEAYENRRMAEESQRQLKYRLRVVFIQAMSSSFMETLGGVLIAGIILYGGLSVVHGLSTPGAFFSFLTALILLYDPLRRLSRLNVTIQQGLSAAERVFTLMDEAPEIRDQEGAAILPPGRKSVEFRDVTFGYGPETVLDGVGFKVEAGEALALVGSSGAGKTTLVDLIPRFFDVRSGAVLVGGLDVREVTLQSLRAQIGIVNQLTILFDDTVLGNIAYGSPERSMEEIEAAARAAYAYDFIMEMPQGFDTMIGEQGVRLSGGQRQRLAMARAILKDAPILILDEATSSLDAEAELEVQKALANLMAGRTTFVIAHRLSTVRDSRRILVISRGRIVEEGDHEHLLALKGEYARLYELQFRNNGAAGDAPGPNLVQGAAWAGQR
jgi:subfamily B ATP-binding cassette protein MsbA